MRDFLVNIVYEPNPQKSAVKSVLNKALSIYRDVGKDIAPGMTPERAILNSTISNILAPALGQLILRFKHEAFKHEAEWRLLCIFPTRDQTYDPKIEYHAGRMGLVPHIRVGLAGSLSTTSLKKLPAELRARAETHIANMAVRLEKHNVDIRARFENLPIHEIWQGPTAERDVAREALVGFLSRHNYHFRDDQVLASDIPLRF